MSFAPFAPRRARVTTGGIRRILVAAAVGATVAATLVGCSSSRSLEAYCSVISEHKDRYLTAMADVNSTDNLLQGLSGMVSAFGDLSRMWEEAAKVAPDDIATDVEAVRDFWAEQFEIAEQIVNDPIKGLTSGLMTGFQNAGAIERVDAYTAQNCAGVGGMFTAQAPAASEPEREPVAETPRAEPSPTPAQPAGVMSPGEGWRAFGPMLARTWDNEMNGNYVIPGVGEISIDASVLLHGAEITDEQYAFGYDGAEFFIVGVIGERKPASGLQPERVEYSVVRIEPTAHPEISASVVLDPADTAQDMPILKGSSRDGVVALGTNSGTIAVDFKTATVAWRHESWLWGDGFGAQYAILGGERQKPGDISRVCTMTVLNYATGAELWSSDDDCASWLNDDAIKDGRYRAYYDYSSSGSVRNIATADVVPIAMTDVKGIDPLSDLAWGETFDPVKYADGFAVVDLSSGRTVFELPPEQYGALSMSVISLFDGRLYVETSDENVIIDVRTGDDSGRWTVAPLAQVGDYVWLTNDTLSRVFKPGD